MKKTTVLRKAIMARRAVVVPGCHDALSAKVIAACGFEAIQISGYGLAAANLGKPDVGLVRLKDVLEISWNIAQATKIPVMAGKVGACADARDKLDADFIINARTDAFAVHGLDEAIRRCSLYLEAGADLAFIDGIKSRADIESA